MGWALGQLPCGTAQKTQLTRQAARERCPAIALPASVSVLRSLHFQKVIPLLCGVRVPTSCSSVVFHYELFPNTENYDRPIINLLLDVYVVHQHKYLIIFSSVFTFT